MKILESKRGGQFSLVVKIIVAALVIAVIAYIILQIQSAGSSAIPTDIGFG